MCDTSNVTQLCVTTNKITVCQIRCLCYVNPASLFHESKCAVEDSRLQSWNFCLHIAFVEDIDQVLCSLRTEDEFKGTKVQRQTPVYAHEGIPKRMALTYNSHLARPNANSNAIVTAEYVLCITSTLNLHTISGDVSAQPYSVLVVPHTSSSLSQYTDTWFFHRFTQ